MSKYIIAIDGGSQSTKVSIFDLNGSVICEDSEKLRPMHLENGGVVEHPDDDLWTSLGAAGKRCMAKFPGDVKDIAGIGLCTIRFCRALLKKDGSLAQPVQSWMDLRVSSPWAADNSEVAYITTSSGYITNRLTGEFCDTVANYQGQWPMDTDTWQWTEDEATLRHFNVTRDMLFRMKMPGEILGFVTKEAAEFTGFPEHLPVVATANDKAVEALGAGICGKNSCLISLGTYIAGMIQGERNIRNCVNFWPNFACIPNQYLYESNGIRRGMWTVSWFANLVGEDYRRAAKSMGMSSEERLDLEAAQVPAGCNGLMTVLDFLAPSDAPYKKGTMIGFDGRHTRAHIYRSILEGIALTMKTKIDLMCEETGIHLDELVISGGGSYSEVFMQIFADVFGIRTSRNIVNAAAGVGSAICAAVAAGLYPDFLTAADHMVKIRDEFIPNMENHAVYKRMLNDVYTFIPQQTDELYQKSFPIFG